MIHDCKNTATVRTISYVTCGTLDKRNYNGFLANYPILSRLLRKKVTQYADPIKVFKELRLN
jgi:hypothetical protein